MRLECRISFPTLCRIEKKKWKMWENAFSNKVHFLFPLATQIGVKKAKSAIDFGLQKATPSIT